jgi:alkylation response protein AidB-like acyl-CoA dehydrogenase
MTDLAEKTHAGTEQTRADELEHRLGDPGDPGNPLGFAAAVAADELDQVAPAAEEALTAYGLNAEFVPVAEGGRLNRMDELVDVMRTVYRRDPALGLGYGASSLIASVNVWATGDADQRRAAADHLLAGRRIAVAYHELAHGNDMASTDLAARADGGQLLLTGRKEIVTNIRRAEAFVLFARTDAATGRRSHSQILVERAALPTGRFRDLPRFRSVGMRGVQLGGIEFDDCPVDASGLLGAPGQGLETAMRSFQLTRTALPAMMTAIVDTGLRVTLGHLRSRELYGRTAADLPVLRAMLAGVFADLLLCEAVASTGLRALHLLPEAASTYAAAVKYTLATTLLDAMRTLSGVLGAQFYLRDSEHAIFQKLIRDIKPVAFGHVSRAACQMTILPQLPLLARRAWAPGAAPGPVPGALFRPGGDLPPLDLGALRLSTGGRDRLLPSLAAGLAGLEADQELSGVRAEAAGFTRRFTGLTAACTALTPGDLAFPAAARVYDLSRDYAAVMAAASAFGTWRAANRAGDGFRGEPAWLHAALARLAATTDGRPAPALPPAVEEQLFDELLRRYRAGLGFGLTARPLPDSAA